MSQLEKFNFIDIEPFVTNKSKFFVWLVNLYRKQLKHHKVIHTVVRWFYLKALPIFRLVFLPYLANSTVRYSRRKRSLVSQRDFVIKEGLAITPIFRETNIGVKTPQVYPHSAKQKLTPLNKNYTFPEVFITSITSGKVLGGSNLIFYNNDVIHHDLIDFTNDYTSEELHGYLRIYPKHNKMRLFAYDENVVEIKQAASFVDATAVNYAHWLSEVLPRIAIFCSIDAFKEVPIIINQGLHKNILDSLSLVLNSGRVVYTLPVRRQLNVETLYITSVTGYVPFDTRPTKNAKHTHDGVFSSQALDLMQKKIFKSISSIDNNVPLPKKILVMRNVKSRGVENIDELKNILISKGYEVVAPENLTFTEQVRIFSNADHVISPTGAALGSTIFCSPNCQVTVMMGIHDCMIYRYWVDMLNFNNIKVNYILGKIVDDESLGIHGNYFIDKNDLVAFLESIDN